MIFKATFEDRLYVGQVPREIGNGYRFLIKAKNEAEATIIAKRYDGITVGVVVSKDDHGNTRCLGRFEGLVPASAKDINQYTYLTEELPKITHFTWGFKDKE